MDILTISPEYEDMMHRWLVGASKLVVHHEGFQLSLMGLGRLDCALRSTDRLFSEYMEKSKVGAPPNLIIDFPCLSGLWTMGMYEILRTLNQKLCEYAKHGKAYTVADDVRELKKKFERVRIPLAKFKTAYQYPGDPNYISKIAFYPNLSQNISRSTGWGWVIDDKTTILRNNLADDVLNLFDKFDDTKISLALKKKLAQH